jgi:putative RecB family exonuclease
VLARARERQAPTSLSPSRAGDFVSCPLLFRFRTIDRLAEPSTPDAVRGTLVHAVLESVFDLPSPERTPAAARDLLPSAWKRLQEGSWQARGVAAELPDEPAWLASAAAAIERWFVLEDPTRLEPLERETYVEARLPSGLTLRGIVDRLDRASDGALRVVDYKTGSAPAPGFESRSLFQLRLYALAIWRSRGVVPTRLQLVYLGERDSQVVAYDPDEDDLLATERKVDAIWAAIGESTRTGEFLPSPGKQCDWCPHHALCPVFGGTTPPLPEPPSRLDELRTRLRRRWRRVRRRLRERRQRTRADT